MPDFRRWAECRECDWQPDPKRRMSPVNQADEHSDDTGHAVHYGFERTR